MIFPITLTISSLLAQFKIEDPIFEYVTVSMLSWYAFVYYSQQLKTQIGLISCVIDPSEDGIINNILVTCALAAGIASTYSLGYAIFVGIMLPIVFAHFSTFVVGIMLRTDIIRIEERSKDDEF
jgi:hypothetical protein